MNMSSMMDACFLLLIYFIVATSLVSEKRLSVSLPGDSVASGTPPPLEPGRVKIDASGAVYWNGDMPMGGAINPGLDPRTPEYRQERELNELVEALKNLAEAAKAAEASAKALFGNGAYANVPTVELTDADFVDGCIDIVTLITKMGLCTSKSESRRSVEQGGVTVNGEKVSDIKAVYTKDQITEGPVVKRGKKTFKKVIVK